jgi:hypothetical protein
LAVGNPNRPFSSPNPLETDPYFSRIGKKLDVENLFDPFYQLGDSPGDLPGDYALGTGLIRKTPLSCSVASAILPPCCSSDRQAIRAKKEA